MKYFKLKIGITILSIAVVSAVTAILLSDGMIAPGLLTAIMLPILYMVNRNILIKLIRVMSSFVRGLEMNDTSMRFEVDDSNRELAEMAHSMNRITVMYLKNRRELETRKLYYDRILRVMTHEMRNSISPIVALSTDIATNPDKYDKDETSEAIGIIRDQSEGIKKFLDSYYALTHLPSPVQEEVDAVTFFKRLSKTVSYIEESILSSGEGVVSYNISNGATLYVDDSLMTQVLTNLIKNSLEAVKERYDRESECEYRPEVRVKVSMSGDCTLITVEDNGPGFLREIAENPFCPFLSTKKNGNGIGLFLSRQIIRMHGGEIKIINQSGKGLSVIINIPCRNNLLAEGEE
ncbi:MAG: HAMP domain-containing histidine kinase [Duncaniella sp.]|nr:HAMP domain-containing histidine kinase [Duncaniella sp.]